MRLPLPLPLPALALAWLTLANAMAADPAPPTGGMLLLHYRWRHDSLTLVESRRVPAAAKQSRLSAEKRRGESAPGRAAPPYQGAPTGFAFELFGADGKRISGRFLQDPGIRRVEYQEKGEHVLRSQEERVDSADIFLRIPEADARTIRFYRHHAPRAHLAQGGVASASAAPVQGPEAAPARSLIAEFALP
jgi:hypothetical protein